MTAPVPDEAVRLVDGCITIAYNARRLNDRNGGRAALLAYIAGVVKERDEAIKEKDAALIWSGVLDFPKLTDERDRLRAERNGNFLDAAGCCKVCDGEIPAGHTAECDIWKLEAEAIALRDELADALALVSSYKPYQAQYDLARAELEQARKDAEQGWAAFYRLRSAVAKDKYPELTGTVRALAGTREDKP